MAKQRLQEVIAKTPAEQLTEETIRRLVLWEAGEDVIEMTLKLE